MMNWDELRKGRFFGHPIHLMLIHFPSALIPYALILDLIGIFSGDTVWFAAAVASLAGGLIFGVLAAFFGFMDYLRLPSEETITATAGRHALLQVGLLTMVGVVVGVRLVQTPFTAPSLLMLSTEGMAVVLLIIGNYQGGELVLRHGIGSRASKDRDLNSHNAGDK